MSFSLYATFLYFLEVCVHVLKRERDRERSVMLRKTKGLRNKCEKKSRDEVKCSMFFNSNNSKLDINNKYNEIILKQLEKLKCI
jgi:predicted RNA-binding protein with RPS1 domain